jgi:HAD superfamily hydrolase (TIGR01509 family)|tara:strand:- start:801 stop:1460 length:660 start_codon:yes stop_codon:yes gene_type:complete
MKWNSIETFFLDMDGTLLDLAYDNYFWHEHIPTVYSKKNSIPIQEAKRIFEKMYKNKKNTIEWYCIEYWSNVLKIDLNLEILKTKDQIKIFPGTVNLLRKLKKHKIKIFLLTNCPREMLNIKITQTKLWGYFDTIISSEDCGYIKESDEFWSYLNKNVMYNTINTVFIDDNQNVLKYSKKNGIKNIYCIDFPDSKKDRQIVNGYQSIENISLFEKKFIC